MKRFMMLLAGFVMYVPAMAFAQTWTIDADHTNIGFKVRHLMVSNVKGEFRDFSGTVTLDERDVSKSAVKVSINTASINTGVAKRDDHLRSADFFDVQKYPTMSFVSRKVIKTGERLQLQGDLTIRGITRPVNLDIQELTAEIKDPGGMIRRGATALGRINRRDFGLTWNKALEAGGVAVGEEIAIILEIEMVRK